MTFDIGEPGFVAGKQSSIAISVHLPASFHSNLFVFEQRGRRRFSVPDEIIRFENFV